MAYQKISNPCANPKQLADELKAFVLANTTFTDAGSIGINGYSFKSPENWYYNFNFTNTTIETTITRTKPTGSITTGMDAYNPTDGNGYSLTSTGNFTYPFVSRHFFTNGKLVAMVIETKSGIFRHHAFGKFDTFGNVDGGEFAGGTTPAAVNNTNLSSGNVGNYYYIDTVLLTHPFVFGWSYYSKADNANKYCWIRKGNKFIRANGNSQSTSGTNAEFCCGYNTHFYGLGGNNYNGRVQLYPIVWNIIKAYQPNALTTFPQIPMYYTDFVALVDIKDLLPEDVVNNDWVVFPLVSKSTTLIGDVGTSNYGIAYKK